MKQFWKELHTKRGLYAFILGIINVLFLVISARFWQCLLPWRGLEIIAWFITYALWLYIIMPKAYGWIDKHSK